LIFPLFLYFEKKAEDPVINLSYFKNRQIVVTLVLSFLSGVILMGTIFVPQFAENAVKIPTGSGGYFVIVLGLFAGIGAPTSGRLIDKFGVKPVLGFGFAITILAALFVIFVAIPSPSVFAVIVALVLMGLGMGFSLGTPLNYMMLENTKKAESNSALATLSLIRSIGTTIAPSIMVAFIASAGMLMQTNVAEVLPANMTVPGIAHADEVTAAFAALKDNPLLPAEYADYQFPDYSQPREFPMTMQTTATSGTLDPSVIALIQSSDVTTIAANTHTFYASIFDLFIPQVVNLVTNGVQNGVDGMNSAIMGLNGAIAGMNADLTVLAEIRTELAALNSSAFDGTEVLSLASAMYVNQLSSETFTYFSQVTTLDGFDAVVTNIESTKDAMASTVIDMQTLITALVGFQEDLPVEFGIGVSNYLDDIDGRSVAIEGAFQDTLNQGFHNIYLTTMAAGIFGFLLLQLYQSPEKRKSIKKDTSEV
ncbi:MAG: MFS transporter, partial [Candidatus Izemoplasmatales bacterium]|nr:MFS transporter [Candidatus Izemoplasmatales bacterium]